MNMDLRNLRHVVVLARELNFTRAAQDLHMTQSALSRSIQAIEEDLGLQLFDRDRRGVYLTELGRTFVTRASEILRDVDDFRESLEQNRKGEEGNVSLGIANLPARFLLPAVFNSDVNSRINLCREILVRKVDSLLNLLLAEEIDFFISIERDLPASERLQVDSLGTIPMSLAARAGHPLLQKMGAEQDPKPEYPLISGGPYSGSFEHFPATVRSAMSSHRRLVIEDYWTLVTIVEESDALCLISPYAILDELKMGRLALIPTLPNQPVSTPKLIMYRLHRRSLSPAALKLKGLFMSALDALHKNWREF